MNEKIFWGTTTHIVDNVDPRRRQELVDGRRVQEDHTAMANLSGKFIHKAFNFNKHVERIAMYNQSFKNKLE